MLCSEKKDGLGGFQSGSTKKSNGPLENCRLKIVTQNDVAALFSNVMDQFELSTSHDWFLNMLGANHWTPQQKERDLDT